MNRPQLPSIALLALALLGSCNTTDKATWNELDRRRETGDLALPPATASPGGGAADLGSARPVEAGAPIPMTTPLLPRNAAPAPEIAGLQFLTGRWVAVNSDKTVNEEIWTPPRGNALIGSFRQIRPDGDCSFVELSQIAIEKGEVLLRLRHLHGRLEVPEDREGLSLFRLVSLTKDRVEFTGTTGAEGVTSVVYERTGPTTLQQAIGFAPETGQEAFVTNYSLDIE